MPLNTLRLGFSHANLGLLCDPHPYGSPATIFDKTVVLGQMDGEAGQWTGNNFSEDATRCVQGSKSARTEAAITTTWLKHDTSFVYLSQLGPTCWLSAWLWLDIVPDGMTFKAVVLDGDNVTFDVPIAHPLGMTGFVVGWQPIFFDLGATGFSWQIVSLEFRATVASGNAPAFNIDNVHAVNGKVFNVRGQTPLPTVVYDVPGEYDPGFLLDLMAGDSKTLANGENSEGSWSAGVSLVSNCPRYNDTQGPHSGSKFVCLDGRTATSMVRTISPTIDCSSLASGKVSCWLKAWPHPTVALEVQIGQNSSNYFKKTVNIDALAWGSNWSQFSFDVSSMITQGAPVWTSGIGYFAITGFAGGSYDYGLDDFVIFEPGSAIDSIWLTKGQDGVEAPLGVLWPESSPAAPAGNSWAATPTPTTATSPTSPNADGQFMHSYWTWTIGTTELLVYPVKLPADKYQGEHRLLARIRTGDSTGGSVRMIGYDENSDTYAVSDPVRVGNSANWQSIDITSLSLPFDGFHRDAVLSQTFSIVGLGITSDHATQAWDINIMEVAPTEGGARNFTPAAGKRFSCWDSRYRDSAGYSQGSAAGATAQSVHRKRTTGELMTLSVGVNNLLTICRDSSTPNTVSSIDLTRLVIVPRYKNGRG
ncbi:MAG: hypothetical protein M1455_06455 [Actinobacteria bacterium]|nr:hypothetical protein [Actinomycetota bacterium]